MTPTPTRIPTATVKARWYTHPTQIRCICGINLYAKRSKDDVSIRTMFVCETKGCDQIILFEDTVNAKQR